MGYVATAIKQRILKRSAIGLLPLMLFLWLFYVSVRATLVSIEARQPTKLPHPTSAAHLIALVDGGRDKCALCAELLRDA